MVMPEWHVGEWHKGFGGWLTSSGGCVRYVRTRLSHRNLNEAISAVMQVSLPDSNGKRRDMRTKEVEDWIREELLPAGGFYFQSIWEQVAEVIASALLSVGEGRTKAAQFKGIALVRKAVSEFMNSFQPVRESMDSENTNLTKFLQFTCRMGYPEEGLPGGVSGFFRNAFVHHMTWVTEEHGGVYNIWGEGPFRASASCTGKSMAGEWITLIPPVAMRQTQESLVGSMPFDTVPRTDLKTPLMVAATCPIGYNSKRHYRETNAIARSQELYEPQKVKHGMVNGYEHSLGEDLEARQTEVCVCIGGLIGINLYPDPSNPGEYLNLDDIIMTKKGAHAMRAKYRRVWEIEAEEWRMCQTDFMEEDQKTVKEGYSLQPNLVRATSVGGNDLFSAEMKVKGPVSPDTDIVGKVFVQGLKAMSKSIVSRLIGVDNNGNEFDIDLVISGHSIKEKKMPFIPLMATASRAGIRYWEDFENPISPQRTQKDPNETYETWACAHQDLVKATYLALTEKGESPNGCIDVYSVTETLSGDAPSRKFVGRAIVGWTRASKLYESERTGTKTKRKDSMPYGTYIRILANQKLKRDENVMRQFNMAAEVYRSLSQFGTSDESADTEWEEPEMELV